MDATACFMFARAGFSRLAQPTAHHFTLSTMHRPSTCVLHTIYLPALPHHLHSSLALALALPPIAAKLVMDDATPPPALAAPSSDACTASTDAPDHASVAALRLKIFLILSDALGLPGPRSSEQDTDSTGQSPRAATDGAQKGSLRQGCAVLRFTHSPCPGPRLRRGHQENLQPDTQGQPETLHAGGFVSLSATNCAAFSVSCPVARPSRKALYWAAQGWLPLLSKT
jgi:hypothetical protein